MNAVITSTLCIEWHSFHLSRSNQPKCMSQLQDFPTVLLQLEESATSGGVWVVISLRVAKGSLRQLLRSLTHTWRHGRSTLQQEIHPLDCMMQPAPHC